MTVYVDDFRCPARVGRISARWSHLTVDPFGDLGGLHEFAESIGLRRAWFQDKRWPTAHYDVTDTKRAVAITAGAVPVAYREMGAMVAAARHALRTAMGGAAVPPWEQERPPEVEAAWAEAARLYREGAR